MASTIPVSSLLADFQLMLREHWAYREGAAQKGEVDCSGAFVWAFRQHGVSIYHGSNRMARVEVVSLIPINVANLVPGMAAFKHRTPGETGYDLPSDYKPGGSHYNGDLNDYYHVGLVGTDTLQVLNAQSTATGFVSSPISESWSHVAILKRVDYSAGTPPVDQPADPASGTATVYAENGAPVKLRQTPSTKLPYLAKVPVGATVSLRGADADGWTPVTYNGQDGYMMSQFLVFGAGETDHSYSLTLYHLSLAEVQKLEAQYPNNNPTITKTNG